MNAATIKYAFIGNAAQCLSKCAAQLVGPNGPSGLDGMVDTLAHELAEAVSDPLVRHGPMLVTTSSPSR